MSLVIRKIQRASAKKKAAKFKFTVTFGELILDCNDKWHPDKVAISLMHRRRRYVCKPRKPESSFASPSRFLVVWPELASDFLEVITTLYKDAKEQYDDKEWTIVVEELNSKGKYRPLAAISLNLRYFVNEMPGTKTELKLKLRPLRKEIRLCTLQIFLSSILLKEGDADDKDVQSITSRASQEVVNGILEHKVEPIESHQPDYDQNVISGFSSINNDIEKWREESIKVEELQPKIEPIPTTSASETTKVRPSWRIGSQEKDKENREVTPKTSPTESAPPLFSSGPPPRPKPRTVLTNKFAEIKSRDEKDAVASPANSENRISTMFDFGLTEQEEKVMKELEEMRKIREDADAIDFRHVPEQVEGGDIKYEAVVPYVKEGGSRSGSKLTTPLMTRKQLLRPFDSDSDEEQKSETTKTQTDVEVEAIKSLKEEIKNLQPISRRRSSAGEEEPETTARREQLRLKARQLLENPAAAIIATTETDEERQRRLREEARRLIDEAKHDGTTVAISTTLPPSSPDGNHREPKVTVYQFKKHQPSPVMQRKVYGSPLIPACSRPTQRLVNGSSTEHLSTSYTTDNNMFDRVKRFGSMRGPELAETIANFVSTNRVDNVRSAVDLNATPTRKIVSKIESDIKNTDKLAEELQKLSDRMEEIDRLDSYIRQKLSEVEPGSEDEQKFFEEKMKLTQEKDALVRKQDYFNVIGTLNETTEKIAIVQQKLAHFAMNDDYKTEEEKQMIDSLMRELKELVDQKNNLTVELMAKEEEEEEHDERSRLTLERTQNFLRGQQEPLSASKRLMNWIRS
uniref:C2 NT-type domain-containing protein n=1 Tax=Acrobeloides nanus TaxID=290746 RepID=A0A914CL31_9BILA